MAPRLRDVARGLHYDVVQAEQSHAEGQLLQFLYKRSIHDSYTHIIAVGCSRPHCVECDCVFRLLLGENYQAVTAAVQPLDDNEHPRVQKNDNIDSTDEFTVAKSYRYQVDKDARAIDKSRTYDNFYIPEELKDLIQNQVKGDIIFSGSKYIRPEGRKRKSRRGSGQVEESMSGVNARWKIAREMILHGINVHMISQCMGLKIGELAKQMKELNLDTGTSN